MTVTGMETPASSKIWVMPSLVPRIPTDTVTGSPFVLFFWAKPGSQMGTGFVTVA